MGRKKRRNEVTAVLFDWDLTLAFAEGVDTYGERLQILFQQAGLDFPVTKIEEAVYNYKRDTDTLGLKAPESLLQTRQNISDYYREILVRLGYVNENWTFYDRLYDAFAEVPVILYKGSLPTLRALQARGLVLGIITNHSSLIRPVIADFVGKYVPDSHVIISQDLQVYKPDPIIFQHAVQRLGVPPQNCIFVGDNLDVDAVGAVQRGGFKKGLWIDRELDTSIAPPLPDHVHRITSLTQVLDFL
jgi:putative hydrolase of the HAD superfamily